MKAYLILPPALQAIKALRTTLIVHRLWTLAIALELVVGAVNQGCALRAVLLHAKSATSWTAVLLGPVWILQIRFALLNTMKCEFVNVTTNVKSMEIAVPTFRVVVETITNGLVKI